MTIAVGMDCQRELDGVWYPAKIRRIDNAGITIEYVDDGNIEGPTHFDPWELRVYNENGVDITELDSDASSTENMKTEEEAQAEEFDVPEECRQPLPIAYDMLDVRHKSNHNDIHNNMGNSGSSGGPIRRKHCHRQEWSSCGELQLRCVQRMLNENVALHSIHPTSLRDDGAIELAASRSHQRNVVARLRPAKSFHSLSDALSSEEAGSLRPMASRCQRCHRWTRWRCRRCNATYYCSRKCQSQDWKVHCKVCEEVEFTPLHPNLVGRRKGHGGTESRAAGAGERKYSWLKTPISSHRHIRENQYVEAREQVSWLLPATMVLFEELRTTPNDLDCSVSDLNGTTTTRLNGRHVNSHAIGNLMPRPLASFSKFDSAKSTRAAAMRMHRQEEEEEERGGNREEGIELTDLGKHYHGLGSQEPSASTQWPIDRYEDPLRQQQQQDSSMPFSNSDNNAASFSVQHFDSSGPFTAEETTAVSSSLRSKGSYDSFGSYQGPAQAGGQAYCLPVGLSAGKARLWDAASSGSLNAGQQSFENVTSCRSGVDFTPSSSLKAADSSERDDNVWQTPPRKSLSKQGGGAGAGASRPSRPSLNPFVSESESGFDENQLIAATKSDLPEAEIIERILQLRMIVGSPDEEIRAAVVAFPNDVNQAAEWLFSHPGESPPPPPSPSNRLAAWAASSSLSSSSSSSLRTSKSFGPQLPRSRRPAPLIDLTAIDDDEANENLDEGYDGSSSSNTRKPSFLSSDRQRANNPFDGGSPHSSTANFDAGENIISKTSPPSELVEPSGCIRYVDGSELSTHPSTVQQFLPNERDQSSPYDTSHWAWQSSLGKTPPRTSVQSPSSSHRVVSSRGDANRSIQDSAPGGNGSMMTSNSFEANIRNACYPILLYQGVESVHQRTCCLIMTQIANDRLSSRLLLITRQPPVLLPEYFRHQSPHRFYQPSSSELLAAKWPETFVHILNLAHDQAEALYSSCGLEMNCLFDFSSHMRKARAIMSSLRPAVKVLGRVAGSQNLELCLRYQLVSLAGDEIFSESECPECSITDPIGNSFELTHPSTVFNERMQQQCPPPKLTPPPLTKEKLLHRSNPGMFSSSLDADSTATVAANNRVHFDDLSFVRPIGSSDFVPVEQDTFTREQVATLMEAFGASEEQAEDALRRSFGDLDTAANWLLS